MIVVVVVCIVALWCDRLGGVCGLKLVDALYVEGGDALASCLEALDADKFVCFYHDGFA